MKIRNLLVAILAMSGTVVFAQEQRQIKEEGKTVFKPHWFIQAQVGAAHTVGEAKFTDLMSPAAAINIGYKFAPAFGARIGGSGWQAKGGWVTPEQTYQYKYLQGNIDIMADLSTLFCGFNPKRVFNGYLFGGYWWLPLPTFQNTTFITVNQLFINSCLVTKNQRGTKTGQNHGKKKSRTLRPKYPLWNISVSFAKVQICPLKNEGKSLFLSFTTHFPTIVLQMWLLQTVLTSNSMTCENRVLNFVLHSDGHFQKRELAIEPKICHPYCPILGFVNV